MPNQFLTQYVSISSLLIAGQGIGVLLLVLFSRHEKNLAKYLLVTYVSFNCICFFMEYFRYSQYPLPEGIAQLEFFLAILEGPLFYLYVRSLTCNRFRLHWGHFIHLLFPVAYISLTGLIGTFFYYLTLIGYLIAAARLLPDYDKFIRGHFSAIDKISLGWLYKLILVYLVSSLFQLAKHGVGVISMLNDPSYEVFHIPNTFIFLINFYLIVMGYRQQPLEVQNIPPSGDKVANSAKPKQNTSALDGAKYRKTSLSPSKCDELWQKLNSHMEKESPFLNNELTLPDLAYEVGISTHQLSQILNTIAGQTFYDYINSFRAEKARQLIAHHANADLAMIDICMGAGFSNKTTFYKHFKKRFSTTPFQYKKSLIS